MHTSTIDFSLAEKLAIVHALDQIILVDGRVHKGELNALSLLMNYLDFDSNFIVQARNAGPQQVLLILKAMSNSKKEVLSTLLEDMALADGHIHEKETSFISKVYSSIDIEKKAG